MSYIRTVNLLGVQNIVGADGTILISDFVGSHISVTVSNNGGEAVSIDGNTGIVTFNPKPAFGDRIITAHQEVQWADGLGTLVLTEHPITTIQVQQIETNRLAQESNHNNLGTLKGLVDTNTAKVSNVDHPLVETAVPTGALFTDTVYDDTTIQAAVDANTAKVGVTTAQAQAIEQVSSKADLVDGKVPLAQLPDLDTPAAIFTPDEVEHVQNSAKNRKLTTLLDSSVKHKKGTWASIDDYLSVYTQDEDTYVKYQSPAGKGYPASVTLWFNIKGKKADDKNFDYKDQYDADDQTVTSGGQQRLAWFHVKAWDDKNINRGDECEIWVYLGSDIDGRFVQKIYVLNQEDIGGRVIKTKYRTMGESLVSEEVATANGGEYL